MAKQTHSERPRLAAELNSAQIVAARSSAAGDAVESLTTRRLPPGVLVPSVHAVNFTAVDTVAAELQSAITTFGGSQRDLAIVVPDAVTRVAILDFDHFPADFEEARAVVRLRFRRNVPFDVDDAAIAFHVLPSSSAAASATASETASTAGRVRVLAVAMPTTTRNEYEHVARQAGYLPGLILPATLAALDSLDVSAPTMLVRHVPAVQVPSSAAAPADNAALHTTSIVIAHDHDILLYRSIEGTAAITPEEVLEDVYPSLVFYEDNFTAPLANIYIDGLAWNDAVASLFRSNAGVDARPLSQSTSGQNLYGSQLSAGAAAPVTGALLGRLTANLASEPYRDRRGYLVRWGAIAAAMAVITIALLILSAYQWRDRRSLDRELAAADEQRAEYVNERSDIERFLDQPQNRGTRDRAALINALIARKSFSWTSVFSELERILPPSVRVAAIRPVLTDNGELGVQLSILSVDRTAALDFIRRIEDTKQFRNAHLLAEQHGNVRGETEVSEGSASTLIRYDVAADYVPNSSLPKPPSQPNSGGAK